MEADSDSDFYGDEETVTRCQLRIDNYQGNLDRRHAQLEASLPRRQRDLTIQATGRLYNPYQGSEGAWQLGESLADFFARLPPSRTCMTDSLFWIRVANPTIPSTETEPATRKFLDGAMGHLHEMSDLMDKLGQATTMDRQKSLQISKKRSEVVGSLIRLAKECDLITGKWLIFANPEDVNRIWAIVARATVANELGFAAKIATRDPQTAGKERVVCVYSQDFTDKDDVARTLEGLSKLRLVKATGGKSIYYKCDAWSQLGLDSGNKWAIKASMYSSSEMFTYLKKQTET